MRPDPHAGKHPPPAPRVVEPGTPEHAAWMAVQAEKREAAAQQRRDHQAALFGPSERWTGLRG